MFMKTLIDGYITPMLTQPDPDFGPLLHAILRVAGFYGIGIVAAFVQNRTMIYVSQGTLRNLRNDLFGNMESCRSNILIPMRTATSCRFIQMILIPCVR